jgi:hypothetical protein
MDQIPAKLIQAEVETLHSQIHKLITFIWNKGLPHQWNQLPYPLTKRVIKLTVVIIEAHHSRQLRTKFYRAFFFLD